MKKEMLNGTPIPFDLTTDELSKMMESANMEDFSLACEVLSQRDDRKAYVIMKSYIGSKDKYRRLCILKTIFRHPEAVELVGFLEAAIASDDFLFVSNALLVVAEYGIIVSENLLLSAVQRYLSKLYTEVLSLRILDATEQNYQILTAFFEKSVTSSQKEFLCEILTQKYLPSKARDLFELFGREDFPKLRLAAVHLGKEYGFDISKFATDEDGHIRAATL